MHEELWASDLIALGQSNREQTLRALVGAPHCPPDRILRYRDELADVILVGKTCERNILRRFLRSIDEVPEGSVLLLCGITFEPYERRRHGELVDAAIRRVSDASFSPV